MIVLDTNVVSELMRARPAEPVAGWASKLAAVEQAVTSLTVAEVMYGVKRLDAGVRQRRLAEEAVAAFGAYEDRVLTFDKPAAESYAEVVLSRERSGRPISIMDAQIAAICVSRGWPLATRNTADFTGLGLELVNPWTSEESS